MRRNAVCAPMRADIHGTRGAAIAAHSNHFLFLKIRPNPVSAVTPCRRQYLQSLPPFNRPEAGRALVFALKTSRCGDWRA
jgi:hypothetical protein